ncbi:hypothetical protein SH467x_002899 [Pirellulaceae bacterium SH467]
MPIKPRERWYSLDGQAKSRSIAYEKSTGIRRLVSLAMLLALVIILIQRMSDVKQIEKVGRAVGLFPAASESAIDFPSSAANSDSTPALPVHDSAIDSFLPEFESFRLRSQDQSLQSRVEMWTALLTTLSDEGVTSMATSQWGESPSKEVSAPSIEAWRESSLSKVQQWIRTTSGTDADESALYRAAYQEIEATLEAADGWKEVSRPFQLAMELRVLQEFQDNSVWRPSEQIALLRTAARANRLAAFLQKETWLWNDIPRVQSSQLMSPFSESTRGVPIRFQGVIGKKDQRQGKIVRPGWDPFDYEVLWVKPNDVSSQPVAILLPKGQASSSTDFASGATIEVAGLYCKRFAYQSQRGSEIAPAILAADIRSESEQTDAPSGPYAVWLRSLPSLGGWNPPKDVEAPYQAILGAVGPVLQSSTDEDWRENELFLSNVIASLLVESQRLNGLADTLLSLHTPWKITNEVELAERAGIVAKVERIPLSAIPKSGTESSSGLAALVRSDLQEVYRLKVEMMAPLEPPTAKKLADAPKPEEMIVYCNRIPKEWMAGSQGGAAEVRQPVVLRGFLGTRTGSESTASQWFVADHVRWQIPSAQLANEELIAANWQPALSAPLQRLLHLGWSLDRKEIVSQQQRPPRPLAGAELPALYSLLRLESEEASQRESKWDFSKLEREDLAVLLKRTLRNQKELGDATCMQPVRSSGRIVRISKIELEDASQRELLGRDHYYQLDCMVDIGNTTFEIPTDREPILYRHEYPATGLVAELPEWLGQAQSPDRAGTISDELLDTSMSFPRFRFASNAWLYRFWSYKTEEMTGSLGQQHRQVVPLLVLHDFQPAAVGSAPSGSVSSESPASSFRLMSWIVPLLAIAAIWFYVRRYSNIQRRPRQLKP